MKAFNLLYSLILGTIIFSSCAENSNTNKVLTGECFVLIRLSNVDSLSTFLNGFSSSTIQTDYSLTEAEVYKANLDPKEILIIFPLGLKNENPEFSSADFVKKIREKAVFNSARVDFTHMVSGLNYDSKENDLFVIWVRHEVENYENWLSRFTAFDKMRSASGVNSKLVLRLESNPNDLVVMGTSDNLRNAKNYGESLMELEVWKNAGVIGEPEVVVYEKIEAAL